MTLTRKEAIDHIVNLGPAKWFWIKFEKRKTGELRTMQCAWGLKTNLRGGDNPYDFVEKQIIPVTEKDTGERKAFGIPELRFLKIKSQWIEVV